ncbi:MAG: hypothetical protein ABSF22_01285 [Bryobacteraceae bacterium]
MSEFIFYMHDGPATFRFELAGNLAGKDVAKLDQAWRTASSTLDGKTLVVDVTFLTAVDEPGRWLLERWSLAGAHFVANSASSRSLVESVTGQPYEPADAIAGPTFDPHFTAGSWRTVLAALVIGVTLLFPAKALAADLKPQTLDAWNHYLDQANARMLERSKGTFLWAGESPERLHRVHAGEVIVEPMINAPKGVPGGLIHHWIGAAFIPSARIDDVITVIRDYDRYTQFYKPSVIESKTLNKQTREDRFTVVMLDKAMFQKRALDSEYRSRFVEVDRSRWYSVAETTHVQELASDRPVPEGEASGYIWRLCTMTRYEERDGGVYVETEALALSRTIPMTLHWMVDPIVRRVSRSSLTLSLEQTRDATGTIVKSAALSPRHKRAE